ncbi:glycosyltransferase [Flavobacterium sp. TP390]|uniref:Glycosyltransferase n=1 Tax=Flavobacterium profundi TaxID=1774945 RepID=A0A6I4IIL3_9FLAO|nr:glycosyltransferase family 2 protein [Flavobacterium profundi]MVO07719.1 glycosyltransferase [Flavobacterium profundi]
MKITIAIPFYNAEEYLPDAIRSVFAQTFQDWELLLIDDGSTDSSLAIAKSVDDERVRVISDGKNKKLAARLNEVTQWAKHDYIVRMDADDLMMPNRIEKQLELFSKNDVDIVTTGVYSVLNNLEIVGVRGVNYKSVTFQDILTRKVGITHAALIAKKSWYERNKYDESLSIAQDLDLWLRTSKKNDLKVISIEEPLYIYREENNVTRRKLIRAYKNERNMIRKYGENRFHILLAKSYFKSLVVYLLDGMGKIDLLQKNRGKGVVSEEYISKFKEAITIIKNTKVKGLNA